MPGSALCFCVGMCVRIQVAAGHFMTFPLAPECHATDKPDHGFTMPKKRSSPNRNLQIADQIQRDLSELLREVKDPRIGLVTFQSVELTPDYAHAKVFFTTLTGDPQQTQDALNHAAGHLHNQLFKRLHIHTVPTLHFHYDKTIEKAVEMSRLIDEANASRAKDE
ncbi:Ribosome-binding factor A [Paraburkholderia saeva]|nr:Ribosome-binding factor A [Paraburkholderia saeva]